VDGGLEGVTMSGKASLEFTNDGAVARITLTAGKANIVDVAMMDALLEAFAGASEQPALHAIVLGSASPHFSFGASIEEHLPDRIAGTLARLGEVLRAIAAAPAPTIAAVTGLCLGGGLELVLACDLVVADETAQFALPEIKLAVFPPAGAALLPARIGAAHASEMILTGANWTAAQAHAAGLVTRLCAAGDAESTLRLWLESDFLPRSPIALHYAAMAARRPVIHALQHDLPELERMYLHDLMSNADPEEGIRAFLEKRAPVWHAATGAHA